MKFFKRPQIKDIEIPKPFVQTDEVKVSLDKIDYKQFVNRTPKNVKEVAFNLVYQFGNISKNKMVCLHTSEVLTIMQLLGQHSQQNLETIHKLTQLMAVNPKQKGQLYHQRQLLVLDIEMCNNMILTTEAKLKTLNQPDNQFPFIELGLTLREIFVMFHILQVTLMVEECTGSKNLAHDSIMAAYNKLALFFDPTVDYMNV